MSIGDRSATDPSVSGRAWVAELAAALGVTPPDDATIDVLLDLAGVAAHASERIAAPIACYLVGLAGADPQQVLDEARAREAARTGEDLDG